MLIIINRLARQDASFLNEVLDFSIGLVSSYWAHRKEHIINMRTRHSCCDSIWFMSGPACLLYVVEFGSLLSES